VCVTPTSAPTPCPTLGVANCPCITTMSSPGCVGQGLVCNVTTMLCYDPCAPLDAAAFNCPYAGEYDQTLLAQAAAAGLRSNSSDSLCATVGNQRQCVARAYAPIPSCMPASQSLALFCTQYGALLPSISCNACSAVIVTSSLSTGVGATMTATGAGQPMMVLAVAALLLLLS
jgi:hypothetical protein